MPQQLYSEDMPLRQFDVPLRGIGDSQAAGAYDGRQPSRLTGMAVDVHGLFMSNSMLQRVYPKAIVGAAVLSGSNPACHLLTTYRYENTSTGAITDRIMAIASAGGTVALKQFVYPNWSSIAVSLTDAPACAAQYGNRMFIVNGTDRKVWDNSTLQNVLIGSYSAMTLNADPEDTGGNLTAGAVYRMSYCFLSSTTGDRTQMAAELVRTLVGTAGDNLIKVDVPAYTPPARFDKIEFYRTAANGSTYWLDSTVTWNTAGLTDQSIGLTADSSLTTQHINDNGDMPLGRGCIVWDDRLWVFGVPTAPHVLYFSKAGQPCSYPTGNTVTLDRYDGMPITSALVHDGRLYVFNEARAYVVQPSSSTTYAAKRLEGHLGAFELNAAVSAYGRMYGACPRGLWVSDGYNSVPVSKDYPRRMTNLVGTPYTVPYDLTMWPADGRQLLVGSSASDSSLRFVATAEGEMSRWGGAGPSVTTEGPHRTALTTAAAISGGTTVGGEPTVLVSAESASSAVTVYQYQPSGYAAVGNPTQTAHWESADLDPDPEVPHKHFICADIYQGASPPGMSGNMAYTVWYDTERVTSSESGTVATLADPSSTGATMSRTRIVFSAGQNKETIRLKLAAASNSVMFDVRKIVLFWTPVGDVGITG